MNRCLLFVTALLFNVSLDAQSILLEYNGALVNNDQTVYVSGDASSSYIKQDFYASTNSAQAKQIKMVRYEVDAPSGTGDYFCWSNCYTLKPAGTSVVWEDQFAVELTNQSAHLLTAYYVAMNNASTASYRYVLYDENNPNDSLSVNIVFTAEPTSSDLTLSEDANFTLFPNPSEDRQPSLRFNNISQENAFLIINNMLGEVVYKRPLHFFKSGHIVDLSTLEAGLYFYSLEQNNQLLISERLIIK